MKLTRLERAVLRRFLDDENVGSALDLDSIQLTSREFTGSGFFANLGDQSELRLFEPGTTDRRGEVHAAVGDDETMVGFIFAIEDGLITDIEGFTYGQPWPEATNKFELLDIKVNHR